MSRVCVKQRPRASQVTAQIKISHDLHYATLQAVNLLHPEYLSKAKLTRGVRSRSKKLPWYSRPTFTTDFHSSRI